VEDNFFDLGGDSLQAMSFLIRIKSAFGIQLTVNVFYTDATIRQLALRIDDIVLLSGKMAHNGRELPKLNKTGMMSNHLVMLKPGQREPAVFIIPGIEGYAYYFKEIKKSFENRPTLYSIQMLGLQEGEKPLTTISEIARQSIHWIKQIQPGGPYKFIGFSFGGLVVYEMIRQLESNGDRVDYAAILDVSANAAASVNYAETLVSVGCRLLEKLGIIESPYPDRILNLKADLSRLGRQEAIEYMISFLREQIDYSSEDVDFWARVLEVLINNVLAIGPISGRINAGLTIVKAAEGNWRATDHDLGWSKHAGSVEVFTVPGTHNQVLHNSLDIILDHMDRMDANK
jgi:thioesterase domain-containing protein